MDPRIGGAPRNPAWLHNVRAHPNVDLNVGTTRFPARAVVVEADNADHGRLWRTVDDNNHHRYSAYQRRTSRPIAVIRLIPR